MRVRRACAAAQRFFLADRRALALLFPRALDARRLAACTARFLALFLAFFGAFRRFGAAAFFAGFGAAAFCAGFAAALGVGGADGLAIGATGAGGAGGGAIVAGADAGLLLASPGSVGCGWVTPFDDVGGVGIVFIRALPFCMSQPMRVAFNTKEQTAAARKNWMTNRRSA